MRNVIFFALIFLAACQSAQDTSLQSCMNNITADLYSEEEGGYLEGEIMVTFKKGIT